MDSLWVEVTNFWGEIQDCSSINLCVSDDTLVMMTWDQGGCSEKQIIPGTKSLVQQWDDFVHSEVSPLIICTYSNCPLQKSAVSNDPASGNNAASTCQANFGLSVLILSCVKPLAKPEQGEEQISTWESLHKPLVISVIWGSKEGEGGYTSAWSGLGMPLAPVPASPSALAPLDQVTPLSIR